MIQGLGIDIIGTARFREILTNGREIFVAKVYSQDEQQEAEQRCDGDGYLLTRFAAKEAVFKALGTAAKGIQLYNIEILTDAVGAPLVRLSGEAAQAAKTAGIGNILISISWETEYAVACAVAQT